MKMRSKLMITIAVLIGLAMPSCRYADDASDTAFKEFKPSELLKKYSDFKHMDPMSAGFISFDIDSNHSIGCMCYGESTSLMLKSRPDDAKLARLQILGNE